METLKSGQSGQSSFSPKISPPTFTPTFGDFGEKMDDRKLQAWFEIANRRDDPLAPPYITVSRSDLSELVDELVRLKKLEAK